MFSYFTSGINKSSTLVSWDDSSFKRTHRATGDRMVLTLDKSQAQQLRFTYVTPRPSNSILGMYSLPSLSSGLSMLTVASIVTMMVYKVISAKWRPGHALGITVSVRNSKRMDPSVMVSPSSDTKSIKSWV